jgi:hypothetical protein
MLGRRLPVVLAVVALATAACEGASRSDQPSRGSAPKAAAAPAPPSYRAGLSQPVADPVYPDIGNPAVDVLHYALALRWAPSKATLSGIATLTIRAARDTDQIRLDFARPLHADKVTVDGKAATASHRGHDLIISAGRRLAKDTRALVTIRYHGRPQTLLGPMVRKDINTVGFTVGPDSSVYSIQEPYGALTWYPVNDHPSDEALYDIALTVPRGWAGVSSGVLRSTSRSGDRVTYRWHAADPLARCRPAGQLPGRAGHRPVPQVHGHRSARHPGDLLGATPGQRPEPAAAAQDPADAGVAGEAVRAVPIRQRRSLRHPA